MLQFTPPNPPAFSRLMHMSTRNLDHNELWITSLFLYLPHYCNLLTVRIILKTVEAAVQDWNSQVKLSNNIQYINTPDGLRYFKGSLTLEIVYCKTQLSGISNACH